jgi:AhpD family alkylhydroperoxidase
MPRRMNTPAMVGSVAMQALQGVAKSAEQHGIPARTLGLVHLYVSHINGCLACIDIHSRFLKEAGEQDDLIRAVVAWRDARCFTDAERAALALTEVATRPTDYGNNAVNEIWNDAIKHYDEQALVVLLIATLTVQFLDQYLNTSEEQNPCRQHVT